MPRDIDKIVSEAQTGKVTVEPVLERLERLHREGKGKRARQLAANIKSTLGQDLSAQDKMRIRQTTDSQQ